MDCLIEICQHPSQPGSSWQQFLGYVSLTPWVVYISALFWLLFALDRHSLLFNIGLYVNLGIGEVLKHATRVPRPLPLLCPAADFAFPSMHVMSVSFVVGYLLLTALLLSTQHPKDPRPTPPWIFAWPYFRQRSTTLRRVQFWLLTLLFGILTAFVAVSREQLGYHTTNQVLAGLFLGAGFGALWNAMALAAQRY